MYIARFYTNTIPALRSTSSPGFIRRRPAIMFPSRVNKSLSPATRQRMQCLRFSTIIIRVMTTVKTIFFRALYRFLSFVGEIFVSILFYITSILIVEFLFFDTHGNHIFTTLTEICFLDFCIVGRALGQCGGVRVYARRALRYLSYSAGGTCRTRPLVGQY